MRRRAVARFGFGGKLAVAKPPVGRDNVRAVSVRTMTLEPELKAHSEAFEEAMSGDLRSYCSQKAHYEADPEREYWSFIEVCIGLITMLLWLCVSFVPVWFFVDLHVHPSRHASPATARISRCTPAHWY